MSGELFDDTDREILRILRQDCRTSYSDIAKTIGTSAGTVRDRINRMRSVGLSFDFLVQGPAPPGIPAMSGELDDADREIVRILSQDWRAGYSDIAKTIGTSAGTVRDRINRMRSLGILSFDLRFRPTTLGVLRASGWTSVPVRQELRRNAVTRIRSGEPLFDDVLGFHNTVIPQVENALLAGHDMIMLGERGQAKTRMIRGLVGLLDEWLPVVAGSEINDDPYTPVSAQARALVAEHGDDTPIAWIHRGDRYGEKLATPDTSIADLIGEVDPIKVAEGRYLSDELTLHYGLVPRTNRGIFAINELPDLAERIQVGLLNVLEERDVQIRGYKVRLPLDVVLVASANPEDYTNRGRIITPLKDRFGAQIRTHYPRDADTEIAIVEQEAHLGPTRRGAEAVGGAGDAAGNAGLPDTWVPAVTVPSFMTRIVVAITRAARSSTHVSQRSGVSVRLSISNFETMVANAMRRTLLRGGDHVVPRVTDLDALSASTAGKVEIETLEEGRETEILERLVSSAVLSVFKDSVPPDLHRAVVDAFDEDLVVDVGDDVADADYAELLAKVPALTAPVQALLVGDDAAESPAMVASAVELVLEGLHLSKRLNKDAHGPQAQYRSR